MSPPADAPQDPTADMARAACCGPECLRAGVAQGLHCAAETYGRAILRRLADSGFTVVRSRPPKPAP